MSVEPPVKYVKNKLVIQTDELKPNTCKIVEVKDGWLKTKKLLVCMGENSKEITIKPLETDDES